MANLKITMTKSTIGGNRIQRETLRTLGLRKIGQSVERPDNEATRGYIRAVMHLVDVEEVK